MIIIFILGFIFGALLPVYNKLLSLLMLKLEGVAVAKRPH